jgi:hypothetical protein
MKKVVFFFIIVLNLCAPVSEAEDLKCKIEPKVGAPGDRITIEATQGTCEDKQEGCYVVFSDKLDDKLKIESWKNDKIEFIVPPRSKRKIINVDLYINKEKQCAEDMEFGVYGIDLVEEAIKLKQSNMQEPSIIDHLDYISRSVKGKSPDPGGYFGDYPLAGSHIVRLEDAGFQDDFIAKFEGHPQRVTLGIAALWLGRTADLVYAPMLRIFLKPRSYFHAYRPYFGSWHIGLLQLDRWDLSVGYTTKTPTTGSDNSTEEKSYVLIGLSNQLNRSALLNIGWALVPGDIEGVESQFYVGFTVDSNFLKEIGIVNK